MEQINNNWEENLKNILDNSIISHKPTIEFLIKQKAKDEIYLFIFYCYCSKLQKNYKKIWASNDFVRRNLGMRKQDLLKAKKRLTDWGIIETTPFKEKNENSNKKVIKKWFVNIKPLLSSENIIQQIKSPEVPSPEVPKSRGWKREPQFLSNNNKFLSNKDNIDIVANATEPFSFESKLNQLISSKDKKLQIIGLYWKFTGISFPSKEAYESGLHREFRPAKNLIGYSLEQIISIFDYLDFIEKNEGWLEKWTLETVHKFIDRVNWVPRDSTLVETLKRSFETKNNEV